MENVLVTLLITAIALIFVAVVLYQRIYKITRNGIYVENGKEKIDELNDSLSNLKDHLYKCREDHTKWLKDHEKLIGDLRYDHSIYVKKVERINAKVDKLKNDCDARMTEQQNSIGFLEHDLNVLIDKFNSQIARLDRLEADINAAIAALSEEDFGIEAETINPKKEK